MGLVDSHAHLTFPELSGQIDDVLSRAAEAGVEAVVTIGTDLSDARTAVALTKRYPGRVYAAGGFHPHEAGKVSEDDLRGMAELWTGSSVVAVGEIGLDYHYDFADRSVQRRIFAAQLAAAVEIDKPIVIHSREALDDTIGLLLDHGLGGKRVVFHCFTGSVEESERIAEHGWRISFTGIVTFRKSEWLQGIAKAYPVDQIMVETDSPYLSPVPVRGRRPNEPAYVAHIVEFLARLRGVGVEAFGLQTAGNTRRFFGLPEAI